MWPWPIRILKLSPHKSIAEVHHKNTCMPRMRILLVNGLHGAWPWMPNRPLLFGGMVLKFSLSSYPLVNIFRSVARSVLLSAAAVRSFATSLRAALPGKHRHKWRDLVLHLHRNQRYGVKFYFSCAGRIDGTLQDLP